MSARCMRLRRSKRTHVVDDAAPVLAAMCGRSGNGWVQSDVAPDCVRCLRKLLEVRCVKP